MPGLLSFEPLLTSLRADLQVYRAPDEESAELRAGCLNAIVRTQRWMLLGNLLNVAMVSLALMSVAASAALAGWAASVVLVCAGLAWRTRRRGRLLSRTTPEAAAPRASASPRALLRAVIYAAALALLWALVPVLWFGQSPPATQLVLMAVSCGMMAVGALVLAPVLLAALAWLGVLGLASTLVLLFSGQPMLQWLAGLLSLYILALVVAVRSAARQFNHRLVFERSALHNGQTAGLLLRDFEEHATEVLWEIDSQGQFTHGPTRLAVWLDQSPALLQSRGLMAVLQDVVVDSEQVGGMRALHTALRRGRSFRDLSLQIRLGHNLRWWTLTAKPLRDSAGLNLGWRGVISDVTQQRLTHERLAWLAHFDALTGLGNRVQMRERLHQALEQHGSSPRRSALLCLDLDHFKSINDSLGHSVGDGVLRLVAERLKSVVRRSDLVARLGGDEFAVLLDDVRSDEEVHQLAQRLVQVLGSPAQVGGVNVQPAASIGVAMIPDQGSTIDEAMGNADLALYAAKEAGRGRCEYYAPWLGERSRRRVALEQALHQAIERGEMHLHWQPWVQTRGWQLGSAEALLRWQHPVLGKVAPAEFIAVAEHAGLIEKLGAWVLRQACLEGAQQLAPLVISVNVSPTQLMRGGLVEQVRSALAESGLPATRLELEITEGIFLDATPTAMSVLHQLKTLGVRIALDDFGTGYSSLAYLRRFPFDTLKIDRAFVAELMSHRDARAVVRTIVDLARVLGMSTVAEGVEDPAQLEVLQHAGCDAVQGYLVARPQPVSELLVLMRRWDSSSRPRAEELPSSLLMPLDSLRPGWASGR